jgi:predicted component of type VI protein secretion system
MVPALLKGMRLPETPLAKAINELIEQLEDRLKQVASLAELKHMAGLHFSRTTLRLHSSKKELKWNLLLASFFISR